MKKTLLPALTVFTALLGFAYGPAHAGQELFVQVDESKMMSLPTAPGAIVIGNPSIADVSIQGQNIFIHGRGFGQTNLVILDLQGNQVAAFDLMVKHTQTTAVSVYKGTARYSYACAPLCESQIQVGDEKSYIESLLSHSSGKIELATGNKTAEAEAPAAPQ